MLVNRLPGEPSRPPGFRSSSPSMLFTWMPVPGTITPEPSPFVRAVLYDHPPLAERIRFALTYRPWAEGRPNRFYQGPGPAD